MITAPGIVLPPKALERTYFPSLDLPSVGLCSQDSLRDANAAFPHMLSRKPPLTPLYKCLSTPSISLKAQEMGSCLPKLDVHVGVRCILAPLRAFQVHLDPW